MIFFRVYSVVTAVFLLTVLLLNAETGSRVQAGFLDHTGVLITEVDVYHSGSVAVSNEYIELCNTGEEAVDLQLWSVDDLDSDIQVVASNSAVLLPGHYALIQLGDPDASESSSAGDGLLQLFINEPLDFSASTDDEIVLADNNGIAVDAVVYNRDPGVSASELNDFNQLVPSNWQYQAVTNSTQFEERSVLRDNSMIFRWRNEAGFYLDTDTKDDWTSSDERTPGESNPQFIVPYDLLITEVGAWQDAGAVTQDFVELYNQDARTVDISGYVISDLDGTDTNRLSQSPALLLPGDYVLVLFNTNGITESTSEPDGVLSVYYVQNTLKPSSTDGIMLLDLQKRVADAVAWHDTVAAEPAAHEIEDLASLCPGYWNYAPDPTNALMYREYTVLASPGGTLPPGDGEGIARYGWEGMPGTYYDTDRRDDWYPAPVTPGSVNLETIPEPGASAFIILSACILAYMRKTNPGVA
jgi:hypothetical protein